MDLEAYGWNDAWRDAFRPFVAESLTPGRVAVEHRGMYYVATGSGECAAEMAGRLRHDVLARSDLPAVGDFVALRLSEGDGPAVIRAVLPRKTDHAMPFSNAREAARVATLTLLEGFEPSAARPWNSPWRYLCASLWAECHGGNTAPAAAWRKRRRRRPPRAC